MVLNRREIFGLFAVTCAVLTTLLLAACGGGGGGRTTDPPAPTTPVVQISISPTTATITVSQGQTFTATVSNSSNTTVTWSVQEANGGTVTGAGVYTAPNTPGTYHVIATSQADSSKAATATVTVTGPVSVSVNPTSASVQVNQTQDFTATITNSTNTAVTWSVQEANGGTVNASGRYTAPGVAGVYHVKATSQADNTKSATAAVTVTAPQPNITSSAPTAANEGDVYTYTVGATDPAGGTLTYALTAAPTGAQISGGVVTWTPTAAQSRVSNSFTVKVTSTTTGQNTQSWTVVPTGVIRGVVNAITAGPDGRVLNPVDLTKYAIYAYIWNSSTLTPLQGTGHADGTFAIPKVPAGYYFVAGGWNVQSEQPTATNVFGIPYLVTDSSNLDLSYAHRGRYTAPAASPVSRKLSLTGLSPWALADQLAWYSPNINDYKDYVTDCVSPQACVPSGATSGDLDSSSYKLGDQSKGDEAFVLQLRQDTFGGAKYMHAVKSAGPLPITDVAGTITQIPAAMNDPASTTAMRVKINEHFQRLFMEKHPTATRTGNRLVVASDPYSAAQGPAMPRWTNLLYFVDGMPVSAQGDVDMGDLAFGNPFPASWKVTFQYFAEFGIQFTAPGATDSGTMAAEMTLLTDQAPTIDSPISPMIGPISDGTIDGKPFFTSQTDVSLTPTIQWQAPTLGTPTRYEISVYKVDANPGNTPLPLITSFKTAATSLQLPPETLHTNSSYVIKITAVQETGVDFASTPMQHGLPQATADAISGMITTK